MTSKALHGVAGAVIAFFAVAVPAMPSATAAAHCNGVTVVVDFTHFGGHVERGCANNPSNGLDALHQAGFNTIPVARYGDAFVCRIDGAPDANHDACNDTPPPSAYWAYYHAMASDSSWSAWGIGATLTHPANGSIEAWAFGARAKPSVSPANANPNDPPPTSPPVRGNGNPTRPATTVPARAGTVAPGVTTTTTSATTGTTVAGQATEPGSTVVGGSTSTTLAETQIIERAGASRHADSSSGSPWPVVITVAALAIAGAVALMLRRRRSHAS